MVVDDATGTIAWIGGDDASGGARGRSGPGGRARRRAGYPRVRRRPRPPLADRCGPSGRRPRHHPKRRRGAVADRGRRAPARRAAPSTHPTGTRATGPRAAAHRSRARPRDLRRGRLLTPHRRPLRRDLVSARGGDPEPATCPGWEGEGLVTRDAHHAARAAFADAVTPAQRRADIDLALQTAAAAGIGLVHENGGPVLSSADDFADVLAAGERGDGPQTVGYWAEPVADEQQARDLATLHRAHGLAGDLNIDGSIGSHTAHLRADYTDAPGRRQRLPDRRPGPRPRRGLLAGRHPGRVPRHRRRRHGHRRRGTRGRRGTGRRARGVAGTAPSGAPRDGRPRPDPAARRPRRRRQRAARVRRLLGRTRQDVCRPARCRARRGRGADEPLRLDARGRHDRRLRLGLAR